MSCEELVPENTGCVFVLCDVAFLWFDKVLFCAH